MLFGDLRSREFENALLLFVPLSVQVLSRHHIKPFAASRQVLHPREKQRTDKLSEVARILLYDGQRPIRIRRGCQRCAQTARRMEVREIRGGEQRHRDSFHKLTLFPRLRYHRSSCSAQQWRLTCLHRSRTLRPRTTMRSRFPHSSPAAARAPPSSSYSVQDTLYLRLSNSARTITSIRKTIRLLTLETKLFSRPLARRRPRLCECSTSPTLPSGMSTSK